MAGCLLPLKLAAEQADLVEDAAARTVQPGVEVAAVEKMHVVSGMFLAEEEPVHALVDETNCDSVAMAAFPDNIELAAEQQVD